MTIAIIVSALVIVLLTSGIFFVSFALKRHEADFDFQFEKGAIAEKKLSEKPATHKTMA